MTRRGGAHERIVIYRLGSLGDTVVALPCLQAVARAFPNAERVLLTNIPVSSKAAPLEAILGGSGLVHRFMAYPVGTRSWSELSALRASLRALEARTLVYLTPSRGLPSTWRDVAFFRLCGFSRIVGAPLTGDLQRNRRGADGLLELECQRLVRTVAPALGPIVMDDVGAWDLHLTAREREEGRAALGDAAHLPRMAINMGGKVVEKDWGEANWSALIARLGESCAELALVFVGGAEDAARAARVGALWPGTVANLCGGVSPRVSAAALAGAELFVGHDSGPLHLAACMGVACVGIYGDSNEPRKWYPYGARHRILHDMRGVLAIDVESLSRAVLAQLARGPGLSSSASSAPSSSPNGAETIR